MAKVSDYFGELTFNNKVMKEKLSKDVYEKLLSAIEASGPLDESIAADVAHAMKEWAIENGATHFSHWFHWGVMVYSRFIIEQPPQDAQEALRLHNRVWNAAMQAVIANGGMINEHHGVGLKLSRYMRKQFGNAWPLLLKIKKTIDPNGIMNPGKTGFGF